MGRARQELGVKKQKLRISRGDGYYAILMQHTKHEATTKVVR
jgi:hypothetical protein